MAITAKRGTNGFQGSLQAAIAGILDRGIFSCCWRLLQESVGLSMVRPLKPTWIRLGTCMQGPVSGGSSTAPGGSQMGKCLQTGRSSRCLMRCAMVMRRWKLSWERNGEELGQASINKHGASERPPY